MKFKVGDQVLVRNDLIAGKRYGDNRFVSKMDEFKGTTVTIAYVTTGSDYFIKEDGEKWLWSEEMFVAPEDMNETQRALMDASEEKKTIPNPDSRRNDPVSHPSHYTQGKIEVIDFIRDKKLDFCRGNVVKYICRAKLKGTELQDLKKARQYCDFAIQELEGRC